MIIFEVSPASAHLARFALISMMCLTTSAIALTYAVGGWRTWWMLLAIPTVAPAATTLAFGGIEARWPISEFVSGVMLPLAITVGTGSLLLGVSLGFAARWTTRFLTR